FRLVQPELEQNIVTFQRSVRGQLAAPESLRRLLFEEGSFGPPERRLRRPAAESRHLVELTAAARPPRFRPFVRHGPPFMPYGSNVHCEDGSAAQRRRSARTRRPHGERGH